MAKTHKDLDFEVGDKTFKTFEEACAFAVWRCIETDKPCDIDVITFNRAAAVAFGGSTGGEQYDEDPDASVFLRIRILGVADFGKVP